MARLCFAFLVLLSACDKGPTRSEAATVAASPVAVAPAEPTGTKYGAGVTIAETVSIDKILETPAAFKGKTVRVEGTVTDVCPKRGCWFEIAGAAPGKTLKFKVTDGEMVFPVDAKGMHAVAQGQIAVRELTLEETKQQAEYQAKEYGKPYDPASITTATVSVRLDGTGAVFRNKK
ncbi:MAG: DUF4920 domain-containing protein [Kofleriaceae bacterium]